MLAFSGEELKDLWFRSRVLCRECQYPRSRIIKKVDTGMNVMVTRACNACTKLWSYPEFPSTKELVNFRAMLNTNEKLRTFYVHTVERQ